MGRHLLAGFVLVAETVLLVSVHGVDLPVWSSPGYGLAVAALIVLRHRSPAAAFAGTMGLATLTGGAYVLTLWASYQAGRGVTATRGTLVVVAAALASLAVRLSAGPVHVIVVYLVFVALPLLAGRYVAQHERLVAALESSNRRLRREHELLAERERLRERLRIARDMHDSLGHRLGLVTIQAAALEVSPLPSEQAASVRRLASAARDAMDELHDLVGALRTTDEETAERGVADIADLVGEYRTAGVPVTLRQEGAPRPLPPAADRAAYRVAEEGLTNAARHAPAHPVTVTLEWETDALLINVVNAVPAASESPDAGEDEPLVTALASGSGSAGTSGHPGAIDVPHQGEAPAPADRRSRDLVQGVHRRAPTPSADRPAAEPSSAPGGPAESASPGPPGKGTRGPGCGHGLRGLRERVEPLGGLIDHRRSGGVFRLFAMLPLNAADAAPAAAPVDPAVDSAVDSAVDPAADPADGVPRDRPRGPGSPAPLDDALPHDPLGREGHVLRRDLSLRVVAMAIAALLFVVLPGVLMIGVGG